MPPNNIRSEICEALAALCVPHKFSDVWAFLPTHADIRHLPSDLSGLLSVLREQFSDEMLAKAGVAQINADGKLQFRATLNVPDKLLVIIRSRETGSVIDIYTHEGSVFEEDLPIFTAQTTESSSLGLDSEQQEVLVAFSIEDVAVLCACGIPATMATGLDNLHPAKVDRLCKTFGLNRQKSRRTMELDLDEREAKNDWGPLGAEQFERSPATAGDGHDHDLDTDHSEQEQSASEANMAQSSGGYFPGRRLVLLGWSPATLDISPPAGYTAVLKFFKELAQHMGVIFLDTYVWEPTPKDINRLKFLMRYEDLAFVKDAILDNLYENTFELGPLGKEEDRPLMFPKALPSALFMLREAMLNDPENDSDGAAFQRHALQQVERLLYEQVIYPMLEEAMDAPAGAERAIRLATSQLLQMFLAQGVIVNACIMEAISDKGIGDHSTLPVQKIKEFLETGDRITKFIREVGRCQQSTNDVITVNALTQPKTLA